MNPDDRQSNYWTPEEKASAADVPPQQMYQPEAPAPQEQPAAPQPSEQAPAVSLPEDVPIQWLAKEYVQLDKGTWWYVCFALVALALIALDVFVVRSWVYSFSVLVIVMAISLIVYIRRPPRDIQYSLSGRQGLYVGERLYHLADFKAFGLINDDGHHSILLIPRKRFSPGVSVYFPEEAGEQIVDILGQRLPMKELKLDAVDRLIRLIRL